MKCWYQSGKLLFAVTFVLGLAILFGGCARLFPQSELTMQYEQQAQTDGRRMQEREQWRRWYRQEWMNGNVYKKGIEAYNVLMNTGLYSMLYAWDNMSARFPDAESRVLLAGFRQLDFEKLQNWMNFAADPPLEFDYSS